MGGALSTPTPPRAPETPAPLQDLPGLMSHNPFLGLSPPGPPRLHGCALPSAAPSLPGPPRLCEEDRP